MSKFAQLIVKAIGLVLFFVSIALLFYMGTEDAKEALDYRREFAPSSTALIESGWVSIIGAFTGMWVYLGGVLKEG